jgi:hypothetical protein
MRDHFLEDYRAAEALATDQKEALRLSLIIASLSNIIQHDQCPVLKAACRARYLEITDGKPLS